MKRFVPFLGTLFLLFSCVKNNPDPSWIEVSDWVLQDNPFGLYDEGELTENITDAWVYVNDEFVGVFEAPFKIPILKEGECEVKLYPTVLNNGISATKKIYPFLEPYIIATTLEKNVVTHIDPVTQYYSNVKFTILDFEDANSGFQDSPTSLANLTTSSDPTIIQPFNGNQFGRVTLTETLNTWISATDINETLPGGGTEVYLEVDYHNTENVVTGVIAIDGSNTTNNVNVQMNEQDPTEVVWKKIYIDLKTIVSGSPFADSFEHSFEAVLGEGKTSAEINIDNVKVVRF